MIILDTSVLSEAIKPSPSERVLRWLADRPPLSVFTTTITQAEILYGVELLPPGKRRRALLAAVEAMFEEDFAGRILPFDGEAARVFPKIAAARSRLGRPISQIDTQIAAIAHSREAAIATRNTADFADCGIPVIDPWQRR